MRSKTYTAAHKPTAKNAATRAAHRVTKTREPVTPISCLDPASASTPKSGCLIPCEVVTCVPN